MVGRANFACNMDPTYRTADQCLHTKLTPCKLKSECYYETVKEAVLAQAMIFFELIPFSYVSFF